MHNIQTLKLLILNKYYYIWREFANKRLDTLYIFAKSVLI